MKNVIVLIVVLTALNALALEPKALTTVSVNEEGENLLADSKGNTLYVFDLDQNQKVPTCNAKCAEVWPPYLLSAEEAKNIQAPNASIVRENKTVQLTYQGRPVYSYAYDRGPAADAGDGIGGVWHYIELEK